MSKKNLPKIVVISDISQLSTTEMAAEAKGTHFTGDPDATTPPYTDTVLHGEADTLLAIHAKRQTKPPTATADEETVQRDIVASEYSENAVYAQGVANKVAKAAGDVAAGKEVIGRLGLRLKGSGTPHQRHFEVIASGIGWVQLRGKALANRAGYIWRYGITLAKETPPDKFSPDLFTLESTIVITNLKSGTIYGFQLAGVLPARKPTYADGSEPYAFSDFIYFVIP